jgi:hypothetical protein
MAGTEERVSVQSAEIPQKADIDAGVRDAYEAEGYILPDGNKDNTKVRERIVAVLAPHKVLKWADREEKAITRGALVQAVFPSLTGPEGFGDADDPQLALAIWTAIDGNLWNELRPGAAGPIQKMVGLSMGNGYVLIRCQIGVDRIGAAYITDDLKCIERDLLGPDNTTLARLLDRLVATRSMLILRQPDNAGRYATGLDRQMKALSASSHEQLKLAIEASTSAGGDDEGGEPGNGDEPGDGPGEN